MKNVHNTVVRSWCEAVLLLLSYTPMFFSLGLITFAVFPYAHLYLPSLYRAYTYRAPDYSFYPVGWEGTTEGIQTNPLMRADRTTMAPPYSPPSSSFFPAVPTDFPLPNGNSSTTTTTTTRTTRTDNEPEKKRETEEEQGMPKEQISLPPTSIKNYTIEETASPIPFSSSSSSAPVDTASPTTSSSSIPLMSPGQTVRKERRGKTYTFSDVWSIFFGADARRRSASITKDDPSKYASVSFLYVLYCTLGFLVSATSLYWNFFKSVFTPPGYVPSHPWQHPPRILLPDGTFSLSSSSSSSSPLPPLQDAHDTLSFPMTRHGKRHPMRSRKGPSATPPSSFRTDRTALPRPMAFDAKAAGVPHRSRRQWRRSRASYASPRAASASPSLWMSSSRDIPTDATDEHPTIPMMGVPPFSSPLPLPLVSAVRSQPFSSSSSNHHHNNNDDELSTANPFVVTQASSTGTARFCHHCDLYKPDDSHHCRSCGRCIFLMDHHCPFVNNCVGRDNMKYFLLFTASIPITAFHITSTMLCSILFYSHEHLAFISCFSDANLGLMYYIFSLIIVFVFFLTFGGFALRFWCLYARGETIISEMIRFRTSPSSAPWYSDVGLNNWMRKQVKKWRPFHSTNGTTTHSKKDDEARGVGWNAEETEEEDDNIEETTEEEEEEEEEGERNWSPTTRAHDPCATTLPFDDTPPHDAEKEQTDMTPLYHHHQEEVEEEGKEEWQALPDGRVDYHVESDAATSFPLGPPSPQVYPYVYYFSSHKAAHHYMVFGEEKRWWARLLPFAPIRHPFFLETLDNPMPSIDSWEYESKTSAKGFPT